MIRDGQSTKWHAYVKTYKQISIPDFQFCYPWECLARSARSPITDTESAPGELGKKYFKGWNLIVQVCTTEFQLCYFLIEPIQWWVWLLLWHLQSEFHNYLGDRLTLLNSTEYLYLIKSPRQCLDVFAEIYARKKNFPNPIKWSSSHCTVKKGVFQWLLYDIQIAPPGKHFQRCSISTVYTEHYEVNYTFQYCSMIAESHFYKITTRLKFHGANWALRMMS